MPHAWDGPKWNGPLRIIALNEEPSALRAILTHCHWKEFSQWQWVTIQDKATPYPF